MWYIAYLLVPKKKVIVPAKWVKEIDEHMEKFINRSINSAQEFLVYYSTNTDAVDENGRPDETFDGKFCFDKDVMVFPEEGCYSARLVKAKGIYYLFTKKFATFRCIRCT